MIRTDCLYFRGDKPCVHKRVCARCPEYRPVGRKLLLIKRGAMGDVLRTTALLPALRRKFPGHAVYWLVDPESADLLAGNPGIDRILPFDLDHALALGAMTFEAVFCLDKEPGAAGLAVTVAARRRFGFGLDAHGSVVALNPASAFALRLGIDDELKFRRNRKTYQEIVAGMAGLDYRGEPYQLFLAESDLLPARAYFSGLRRRRGRPSVGLNTGAGTKFETKQWPVSHYRRLIGLLTKSLGADVFLLGGAREAAMNRGLARGAGPGVFDTGTGHPLREFAGFVAGMDAVVTSDTLGMHIAIALGKPVVALFGSTAPQEISLYGRGSKLFAGLPCAPCYKRTCPDAVCMAALAPARVLDEVRRAL